MNREVSQTISQSQVLSRSLMRNVYLWMAVGLAITGVVAYGTSQSEWLLRGLLQSNGFLVLFIAQIALVFYLSARIMQMSPTVATIIFALYATLNGLTMAFVFLVYTGQAIAATFFISAGMFASMSVFALVTKSDLSSWRSYLFMGLIGVIIASLVNVFLRSNALGYLISYAGVIIFMGLTAYDTKQIKRMSDNVSEGIAEPDYIRLSIMGALKLYLDFINIFLFMLRIFGGRK